MPEKLAPSNKNHEPSKHSHLELTSPVEVAEVLELLPPGSFATLDNHPGDLPPFQIINCKGGLCRVRQQAWGKYVHWDVEHNRLKSA